MSNQTLIPITKDQTCPYQWQSLETMFPHSITRKVMQTFCRKYNRSQIYLVDIDQYPHQVNTRVVQNVPVEFIQNADLQTFRIHVPVCLSRFLSPTIHHNSYLVKLKGYLRFQSSFHNWQTIQWDMVKITTRIPYQSEELLIPAHLVSMTVMPDGCQFDLFVPMAGLVFYGGDITCLFRATGFQKSDIMFNISCLELVGTHLTQLDDATFAILCSQPVVWKQNHQTILSCGQSWQAIDMNLGDSLPLDKIEQLQLELVPNVLGWRSS